MYVGDVRHESDQRAYVLRQEIRNHCMRRGIASAKVPFGWWRVVAMGVARAYLREVEARFAGCERTQSAVR